MTNKKEETEVIKTESSAVEYKPLGAMDNIKLSAAMVRDLIAIPTKTGKLPTNRDCVKFVMFCLGKRANPFEGDCYLVGYDSQTGPTFSLICGIDLFLKRAEQSDQFDGYENGVICIKGDAMFERSGTLVLEGEKLLGAWSKVFRKDRNIPIYTSVSFKTYNTDKSRWKADPAGQIAKVALSQGLRRAYPTAVGGMYTEEEMTNVVATAEATFEETKPIEMPKEITEPEKATEIVTDVKTTPKREKEPEPTLSPEETPKNQESKGEPAPKKGLDLPETREQDVPIEELPKKTVRLMAWKLLSDQFGHAGAQGFLKNIYNYDKLTDIPDDKVIGLYERIKKDHAKQKR